MQLHWTAHALEDREAIFDYIEQDSPKAAVAVDERIERQVEMLTSFPEIGRPGRIEGTRELVIQRTPYIVAYQITPQVTPGTIRILRVLHGAQRWPDFMPEA